VVAEGPNLESQSLAGCIQTALVERTKAVIGHKAEQFFRNYKVRNPAVLVEGGFLTNKDDIAHLSSVEYRSKWPAPSAMELFVTERFFKATIPTAAVNRTAQFR